MAECSPGNPDMGCASDWDTLDPGLQDRATELAWETIRYLTAGMVGNCPIAYRPCVPKPCSACSESWLVSPYMQQPYLVDGRWYNQRCGQSGCSCVPLSEVVFPGRVASVEAVYLDGVLLDPWAYRLDHNHRLLRVEGGVWPACQDMRLPETEVGTFSVHYVPGVQISGSGLWAVGVLAYEFSRACVGEKCRLPSSVTSITRQGVSMQFDNSMFSNGQTGIREVDAYVLSVNPHRMKVPPMAWSPDVVFGRGTDIVPDSVVRG